MATANFTLTDGSSGKTIDVGTGTLEWDGDHKGTLSTTMNSASLKNIDKAAVSLGGEVAPCVFSMSLYMYATLVCREVSFSEDYDHQLFILYEGDGWLGDGYSLVTGWFSYAGTQLGITGQFVNG